MFTKKLFYCYKYLPDVLYINILPSICSKVINLQPLQINRMLHINLIKFTNATNDVINQENVNLKDCKQFNYSGTKFVLHTLQNLLNVTQLEAKIYIRDHPKLIRTPIETIEDNYKLFQQHGISDDILKRYPNLLALQDGKLRLNILKQLSINVNSSAPLLLTNISVLRKTVRDAEMERNFVPYGNRITHLSKMLQVPEWEISEKLIKHHYILRIPIDRLNKVLKILLDFGVEPNNIMSDFWSIRYSPELAERRLQRALNANVHKVKAWMIRCPDKVFERCIERQVENRKILGADSSVEEYLSKRLDCSIENAKYLTGKYPALEKMNISKMKEIMDYLFEKGYGPGHICRVPRILIHSLETTKIRLRQLKLLGYVPPSLAILCKSKRDYDKYLKILNKKKLQSDYKEI